ncbi:MAG: hypothetical protein QOI48_1029 [Solirubrobacteraceae bacterium]|jgi:hypothetical protein|nr:hypothetical protein [Solirubrobacteraceae bacterium]
MRSCAVDALAAQFAPTTLDELEHTSALRERVESKYIVTWETFEALAGELLDSHRVLEIDDLRVFTYETLYFDSGSLKTYRDHVMQRRKRFRIRSRRYVESDSYVFEVKLKGPRGQTIKHRLERVPELHRAIDPRAEEFLDKVLIDQYHRGVIEPLEPTLNTKYRRLTLASAEGSEKLTCDFDLRLSATSGRAAGLAGNHVMIESKSERGGLPADRVLRSMGARPVSCSKYCVGIAMTHHAVKTNGFRRLMSRYFIAEPEPAAALDLPVWSGNDPQGSVGALRERCR